MLGILKYLHHCHSCLDIKNLHLRSVDNRQIVCIISGATGDRQTKFNIAHYFDLHLVNVRQRKRAVERNSSKYMTKFLHQMYLAIRLLLVLCISFSTFHL